MEPITDQSMAPYRHILMYDDETVTNAAAEMKAQTDPPAQEWWHIVVDLGGGRYAVARIGELTDRLKQEGAVFLETPLGELVGKTLVVVDVVVDQDKGDLADLRRRTADTPSAVAVVQQKGEFKGIIAVGGTRAGGTRGVMDTGLLGMAGKYAAIPDKGTLPLSARRKKARSK